MDNENAPKKEKWYLKTPSFVIAFLCVGPLALPLAWFNPRYSVKKKVIITVIVLILSYFMMVMLGNSLKTISEYYKMIQP